MVSFWPWKSNNPSPASFEKTLSTLSNKIATAQHQLDRTRAQGRRVRVLGSLYLAFAYVVYAIVLLLVVGWRNLGALEWSGLAGGPVFLYAVRAVTAAVYGFRTEGLNARLKEYHGERARTIQKLKEATRYDSTLQLLEKYGGAEGKSKKAGAGAREKDEGDEEAAGPQHKKPREGPGMVGIPGRTTMPPPPTANIQPRTRQHQHQQGSMDHNAVFAPNAWDSDGGHALRVPGPSNLPAVPESHWYNRLLDSLLGEDETAIKNRFALICATCHQVNGQAPPGTKSLGEVGIWKCMACGAKNGEMDEGERIVRQVLSQQTTHQDAHYHGRPSISEGPVPGDVDRETSDLVHVDEENIAHANVAKDNEPTEPRVTKRRGKGPT